MGLLACLNSCSGMPLYNPPSTISPTFSGTVTFPDGSTWTITGPTILTPILTTFSAVTTPNIALAGTPATGIYITATQLGIHIGDVLFDISNSSNGLRLAGGIPLGWVDGEAHSNVPDLTLWRDAADVLALKRATNAGTFRIYSASADAVAGAFVGRKSRGTVASPTVITTGDDLLDIIAQGYVGATNTWQEAARIKADSTGTISDSATGIAGIWRFLAAKTGAEPAEIVQVNGTDQHLLHVGTAPTITAGGGTSPTIAGTDEAFTVTIGTGGIATSVEVTFANAFAVAPRCCANHQGAILILRCVSTTTKVTIDAATPFTASGLIDVICRSGTT